MCKRADQALAFAGRANAGEPYLVVSGLSKSYGAASEEVVQTIFHSLDLEVFRFEFLTLLGPNGCGKTTLLKLIAGLDPCFQAGSVTIGGKSPSEARVGFVFQDFQNSLYPWKTNIDNIAFPLELAGECRSERRKRAREILERFKIEIPEARFPHELSGGQRQLVAIARALLMEPEILIMDEPFAHIDFETRLALQLKLMALSEVRRMTLLFVSHDVDEATFLGDRIAVLSSRPATLRAIVDNPLPRPRCYDDLRSPVFFDVRSRVLNAYGREVMK
jgi:NitT/TauT family transport system ATP-binding protein